MVRGGTKSTVRGAPYEGTSIKTSPRSESTAPTAASCKNLSTVTYLKIMGQPRAWVRKYPLAAQVPENLGGNFLATSSISPVRVRLGR